MDVIFNYFFPGDCYDIVIKDFNLFDGERQQTINQVNVSNTFHRHCTCWPPNKRPTNNTRLHI